MCASTGNTAASAAAYAARAGLPALVLQPAGAVALGKLAQARALGARVLEVRGSFDEALAAARELAARGTHVLVNSLNPHRLEGQKTAAFEIVEELGGPPDALALPYGGGGNTCAYAMGFEEAGAGLPRIVAVQAAERAATLASAIRIGEPAHARAVEHALERTGGTVVTVTTRRSSRRGACSPTRRACSASRRRPRAWPVSRAGLEPGSRVVCVVTGHGLKDPEAAARLSPEPVAVDPDRTRSQRPRDDDPRPRAGDDRQPRARASTAPRRRSTSGTSWRWARATRSPIWSTSACARSPASPRRRAGRSAGPTASRAPAGSARARR